MRAIASQSQSIWRDPQIRGLSPSCNLIAKLGFQVAIWRFDRGGRH
jgi:hypothetical protein